ncbi:MAG: hypothetical protein ACXW3Z_12350 [Limisphaerales bacterium]
MRYCAEPPTASLSISSGSENDLYMHLYQAVQDLPWKPVSACADVPARTFGTLLVFCYFRELYSSAEIALTAMTDPDLQYICTRTLPEANDLRSFRRANRPMIEHALATLIRIHSNHSSQPIPWSALNEAKRRVDLAVRSDCFELDI